MVNHSARTGAGNALNSRGLGGKNGHERCPFVLEARGTPGQGNLFVGRFSPRALSRIAAVGALVMALGLTGCGRKGGLDPPPAAAADPMMAPAPAPEIGPDGRPLPPYARSGSHQPARFSH